jgi:V8-like Glu-specific endopeptidase
MKNALIMPWVVLSMLVVGQRAEAAQEHTPSEQPHVGEPPPEKVDYYFNHALAYQADTTASPQRALVRVIMQWPDGYVNSCSGTLVSGNVVATAAHCVFDASRGGYVQRAFVIPGEDYKFAPYGLAEAIAQYADPCYTSGGSSLCDKGLIALDRPLGNVTGWYTATVAPSNLTQYHFDRAGYGQGEPSGDPTVLKADSATYSYAEYNQPFYYFDTLTGIAYAYDDTSPGDSGSTLNLAGTTQAVAVTSREYASGSGPNILRNVHGGLGEQRPSLVQGRLSADDRSSSPLHDSMEVAWHGVAAPPQDCREWNHGIRFHRWDRRRRLL